MMTFWLGAGADRTVVTQPDWNLADVLAAIKTLEPADRELSMVRATPLGDAFFKKASKPERPSGLFGVKVVADDRLPETVKDEHGHDRKLLALIISEPSAEVRRRFYPTMDEWVRATMPRIVMLTE